MNNYNYFDLALARVLYQSVNNRCFRMTYSECAEEMTKILGQKVNAHGGLRMPLYHVGALCNELNLPLITAIVRLKSANSSAQVGEGFYKMACEFYPEYKEIEPIDAWKTEISRIQQCKNWNILDEYLKRHEQKALDY